MRQLCVFFILITSLTLAQAGISVVDDAGRAVTLATPAKRIVSLAPHATELLFAAGAGTKVVGVSEYSNYPPETKHLPSVGDASMFDLERIAALKPDLIVTWGSGNPAPQVAKVKTLGVPIFESEAGNFDAIASSLERLARLSGTEAIGHAAAEHFRQRLKKFETHYRHRTTVTVFYQIWRDPLMTLNDAHLISAAIRLCGGRNIFGALPQLAPTVSIEAVLKADPEVIVTGSTRNNTNNTNNDSFTHWRRFAKLKAVAQGNLVSIDSDLLTRASPRILDGAEMLCQAFDQARAKRK